MERNKNFLQRYGDRRLRELVADWREQALDLRANAAWANFPSPDFIAFCRSYPRTPFDGIPTSPQHLKEPTFLISQAHRIWQTTSLVYERVAALDAKRLVDLGSFPFFLPLVLRDYFGFSGSITATTNLKLEHHQLAFLDAKGIQVELLDLDPYVRDPRDANPPLPTSLSGSQEQIDLVVSSHVIEHLYHPRTMLEESARSLRAGGELIVTTDNAMMLDVFLNYISAYGYTFEPVETTAAMHFSFWRGHVRFFTERDLSVLLQASGLTPRVTKFFHCFYDVFFEEYFREPVPRLQGFKATMLKETDWLRNDIAVVATKAPMQSGSSEQQAT